MKAPRRILGALVMFAATAVASASFADQPNLCIKDFSAGKIPADGQVQELSGLVQSIGDELGSSRQVLQVAIFPCAFVDRVLAVYANGSQPDVPKGEYIIFNQDWLREVAGRNLEEAIFIIGHEYGHFLNRHFEARSDLDRKEKEKEADITAGCALARMGGHHQTMLDLISRIRREQDDIYPNRAESQELATKGFSNCGGLERQCRVPENGIEGWEFEQSIQRSSGWMGGGFSTGPFCDQTESALRREYPDADQFQVISSWETTRETCRPFHCVEYQYTCVIVVRDRPIFRMAANLNCP